MDEFNKIYKCYLFSNDLDQVKSFSQNEECVIKYKYLEVNTNIMDIRNVLNKNFNISISKIDLLDDDRIFILVNNYNKIMNYNSINNLNKNEELFEVLQRHLFVNGMEEISKLSVLLPEAKNKTNAKYRRQSKQLNLLKSVLSENFGKIL